MTRQTPTTNNVPAKRKIIGGQSTFFTMIMTAQVASGNHPARPRNINTLANPNHPATIQGTAPGNVSREKITPIVIAKINPSRFTDVDIQTHFGLR